MAETRVIDAEGAPTRLFDGPDLGRGGPGHVGSTWRQQTDGRWQVSVNRRFATRDEALRVLEFVASLSEHGEESG